MIKLKTYVKRRSSLDNIDKQRKKYPDIVMDVIEISDIVLEVLDARFIEETRNKELEEHIKKKGKKIIYVINKIDLADSQKVREIIAANNLYPYAFVSCKNRIGGKILRDAIKIEASRVENDYLRKQVGIIGYPNTGKSSIINLLAGKAAAKISSESGFTKSMQKIRLTKEILLLDTPGLIPLTENSTIYAKDLIKHATIGVRNYDKVKDPEMIVYDLITSFPGIFEKYYNIEANSDYDLLIEKLGKKRKFLRKGGEVNEDRTARSILKDWQEDKIKTE
jgi:ribosome biogenesis GTPase A